jgi:hypothetical protein
MGLVLGIAVMAVVLGSLIYLSGGDPGPGGGNSDG